MKKLTNEEFKKIYEDHQHFIKQDCTGWEDMRANFDGCSFEDLHFDSDHLLYLAGANFKYANLKGVNFKRADLDSANFEYANLEGICLKDANIIGANFHGAYIINADLSNCICNGANFKYANLTNADLSESFSNNTNFEGAILTNANLTGSYCDNSNFDCAVLRDSNIQGAVFDNSNLTGVIFDNAKGKHTRFYNSKLYNASFDNVNIDYAQFSLAYIKNTNFTNSNLREATFHGAYLRSVKFYKTNIENGSFSDAHLDNIKFDDCNMSYTNFDGANIVDSIDSIFASKSNIVNGKNIEYMKGKILTDNIIGYKKCRRMNGMSISEFKSQCNPLLLPSNPFIPGPMYLPHSASKEDEVIVTLEIPRGAVVFSINGHKCRTNKAKVIAIDGADKAMSLNYQTSYYVGDEFTIYNFNCVYNKECAEGIHFFLTREEAEKYIY